MDLPEQNRCLGSTGRRLAVPRGCLPCHVPSVAARERAATVGRFRGPATADRAALEMSRRARIWETWRGSHRERWRSARDGADGAPRPTAVASFAVADA